MACELSVPAMRAFLRRSFWMRFLYRLGVLGVGLAYLMTALEIPLPARIHKVSTQPFPCQDHPCGCQTAEQCWSHCCCFTPEERWAWAKDREIEPPSYAEKPVEKSIARGWNNIKKRDRDNEDTAANTCCQAKAQQSCCCNPVTDSSSKKSSSDNRFRNSMVISVWRCQGYSTFWISAGAVLPIPPIKALPPIWSPPTSIALPDMKADRVPSTPLDPPPRLSVV